MYDTPLTTQTNTPSKRWYQRPAVIAIFLALVSISFVAGLAVRQFSGKDQAAQQITILYYNDGKTPLWQTGQEKGENTAFITYAIDQLKTKHGNDYQSKGSWKVITSLDKKLQDAAIQQMQAQRQNRFRHNAENAALVAEDVTNGQIVSWVSDTGQSNVQDMIRQKIDVGTLQIPFAYLAFLEHNPTGVGTFSDTQEPLPGYPCTNKAAPAQGGNCLQNLDGKYLGPLSLPQALGGLRNVPAIQAVRNTSITEPRDIAVRMGSDSQCYLDNELTQPGTCYSASVFGAGLYATPQRILQAYATLTNQGRKSEQTAIQKTMLNGKTQYQWQSRQEQTIRQDAAKTISAILSDTRVSFLDEKHHTFFKTDNDKSVSLVGGYSFDGKVSSTIQFTDKYVVGVWVSTQGQLIGPTSAEVVMPQAASWLNAAD